MEIWKDIDRYEGLYQVSNFGRVKSIGYGKERVLKAGVNSRGYLNVVLFKDGKGKSFTVHRLVAIAFIPNPENKEQIDHIDTVRTNNRVSNLRWCTQEENQNNSLTKKRRSKSMKSGNNPNAKKVVCDNRVFECITECAEYYGINTETMRKWLCGECRTPQKFKDLNLHYATEEDINIYPKYDKNVHGENANIKVFNQNKKMVICDGMIFNSLTECANFYGEIRQTMGRWLAKTRPMPQKYKDLGLRYATEQDLLKQIA